MSYIYIIYVYDLYLYTKIIINKSRWRTMGHTEVIRNKNFFRTYLSAKEIPPLKS